MRVLPLSDPGTPDLRSPARYLLWLGRNQLSTLGGGLIFGVIWMVAQALTPAAIGAAIDKGIIAGAKTGAKVHPDWPVLWKWIGVIFALTVIQAISGVVRHRFAVTNWLVAAFRSAQLLGDKVANAGTEVTSTIATGDVVNTVASDAMRIGGAYDVVARFAGAIVSYIVVSIIMLKYSTLLGLIVMIGVPILVLGVSPLIKPLQQRQQRVRDEAGKLTAIGADTVAGLRILRGIGGEATFLARYVERSQEVRQAGVDAANPQATLDATQIALPAVFILIVTWVGARLALSGDLNPGQLVAFYGYSVFLIAPLRTATEFVEKYTRAMVGAKKVIRLLEIPSTDRTVATVSSPPVGSDLVDDVTGVRIAAGTFAAIVSNDPVESTAVAERLGCFQFPAARLGDVQLTDLALNEVRRRVVVSETEPRLFSGTLRHELLTSDVDDDAANARLEAALEVASAGDVIEALPDGLDTIVEERGRSFSGGQRQRLTLARALLTSAETLILIEPTSAVDAHTESRIAERLHDARLGHTTVLVTSSPLMLDRCDNVAFIDHGQLVAYGPHRELLETVASYRATVLRGEDE